MYSYVPSIYLLIYLCIYIYIHNCVFITYQTPRHLSIYLPTYLSIYLSIYLSPICFFIEKEKCTSTYPSMLVFSSYLSTHLPTQLFTMHHPSVHLSFYTSIYPSIWTLSTYASVYHLAIFLHPPILPSCLSLSLYPFVTFPLIHGSISLSIDALIPLICREKISI